MVANAPIPHGQIGAVLRALSDLDLKVDNAGRRIPNSLLVQTGAGQVLVNIGPSGFVDADGNSLNSVTINDPISGTPIISQSPAATVTNPDGSVQGSNWFWRMDDESGNRLIATDGKSGKGLALPYIPVPMYPRWNTNMSTTPASDGSQYASVTASAIATQKLMWEGRIGYCSHPVLSVDGIWGRGAATGAEVVTYTVKVGGTEVVTIDANPFTATAIEVSNHKFDVSGFITQTDLTVQLLAQSSISNTDQIICQVLGVWLRQTP